MKRIFTVKDHGDVTYHFESKMAAKAHIKKSGSGCVSKGPDHIGNHGYTHKRKHPKVEA